MPKFKIGDKVIVNNGELIHLGKTGIIEDIRKNKLPYLYALDFDHASLFFEEWLSLAENN